MLPASQTTSGLECRGRSAFRGPRPSDGPPPGFGAPLGSPPVLQTSTVSYHPRHVCLPGRCWVYVFCCACLMVCDANYPGRINQQSHSMYRLGWHSEHWRQVSPCIRTSRGPALWPALGRVYIIQGPASCIWAMSSRKGDCLDEGGPRLRGWRCLSQPC